MATDVIYNGVKIHNVLTQAWSQQVVYDSSGTDLILHKFRLRFQGHVHIQPSPEDITDAPTYTIRDGAEARDTLIATYEETRRMLATPRKNLDVRFADSQSPGPGDVLFRVVPPLSDNRTDRDIDVDNGPKPKLLDVQHIVADKVLKVVWEVECAKVDTDTTSPVPDVLNNRWSIQERMDDNFAVTRTIRGQVRFALGDAKAERVVPAHGYKHIVVPPLEDGFRREEIDYSVTPDGLSADYTVTDRQTDTAAPWPATKISGTHTEGAQIGERGGFTTDTSVRLEGPPGCDKQALLIQALRIVDLRQGITITSETQALPLQAHVTEHFGQAPAVEVRILSARAPVKDEIVPAMTALWRKTIGKPLELPGLAGHTYSKDKSPIPPMFGYAGTAARSPAVLFILHCFLQRPDEASSEKTIGTALDKSSSYLESSAKRTRITSRVVSDLPPAPLVPKASKGHQQNVYTFARMQSRYIYNSIRVQLPIAKAVSEPSLTEEGAEATNEDTCSIFTLARGVCQRVITIDAERAGKWPLIPKPKDTYEDDKLKGTLLDFEVRPQPATYSSSGQFKVWRVQAIYRYAMNRPPKDTEKIRVGSLPFTSYEQADNLFDHNEAYSEEIGP